MRMMHRYTPKRSEDNEKSREALVYIKKRFDFFQHSGIRISISSSLQPSGGNCRKATKNSIHLGRNNDNQSLP